MPHTLSHPTDTPVRIGLYMPRAFMRLHTKKSQWDFSMAVLNDVLRVYPSAKVEVTSGDRGDTQRRLEVAGANPNDVKALVLASIQANKHILTEDTAKKAAVVLAI